MWSLDSRSQFSGEAENRYIRQTVKCEIKTSLRFEQTSKRHIRGQKWKGQSCRHGQARGYWDGHRCWRKEGPIGKGAKRVLRTRSCRRTRGMKLLIPHRLQGKDKQDQTSRMRQSPEDTRHEPLGSSPERP